MPGNPDVVAVARRFSATTPRHAGVAIYENGVQRPVVTPDGVGSTVIDFGGSAARLYGYDNETSESGFRRMAVDANGVTVLDNATGVLEGAGLDGEYEGGFVYSTAGHILDPEPRTIVAMLPDINPAGSLVEATPGANYYLTGSSPSSGGERRWHLKAFDRVSGALTNDWDVPGVNGAPHGLVHLGGSTLAFADVSRIVLIHRRSSRRASRSSRSPRPPMRRRSPSRARPSRSRVPPVIPTDRSRASRGAQAGATAAPPRVRRSGSPATFHCCPAATW